MHWMFQSLHSLASLENSSEVNILKSPLTHVKTTILLCFRIHTGEKPFKCDRVDHECSKAFSTPHSLKSHLKTHEKKGLDRGKSNSPDDNKMIKKELNFMASAEMYPSGGSSSEDTDSMLFENNLNIMQFHIVDGNGNNIKYNSPIINYVTSQSSNLLEQTTNEAVQFSLANEVEMGSPWVDISVLANKSVMPSTPVTSSCVALSTAIPTYVNLPTYQVQSDDIGNYFGDQPTGTDDQAMKDLNELLMTDEYDSEGKTLKSITADAGICQCTNCKCDPMQENGCIGGCGPEKPCRVSSGPAKVEQPGQMEIDTKSLIEEIDSLNVDTTKLQSATSSCDCKDTKDAVDKGCCVVICLKTLETVNAVKQHGCGERKAINGLANRYQNLADFGM